MTTLVVAAHPDDEVLGCGGTIARLVNQGEDVHVAILGEGITSRHDRRKDASGAEIAALHADSYIAVKTLGAQGPHMLYLPDNRFDTLPLLDVIKAIEKLIADINPDVIYTHHHADLNVDHRVTHQAVLTAARPGCDVMAIYAFEVPSSTEWTFQATFRPNVFVNITPFLSKKLEAMEKYESEVRDYPHPRSRLALESRARYWGSVTGRYPAVEPFELVRSFR